MPLVDRRGVWATSRYHHQLHGQRPKIARGGIFETCFCE